MKAPDLISVIVPTFNRADTICEAIDSVLGQTYQDFELHVVDDGSTDDTWTLLQQYADDGRVHVYRQINQGQATARNFGLSRSQGTFVCFLDSDNAWLPNKLSRQVEVFCENPKADVVYGDIITIDEGGAEVSRQNMTRYSGTLTYQLLLDNCVSFNTAMTRRHALESIGGLDSSVRFGDDYDLWLRVSVGREFLYVPEFFARYRVQRNQISANKEARFASNQSIIIKFLRDNPDLFTERQCRDIWSFFYQRRARYRSSAGHVMAALGDVGYAVAQNPISSGLWRTAARIAIDAGPALIGKRNQPTMDRAS